MHHSFSRYKFCDSMISAKQLMKMVKKWQTKAFIRKAIFLTMSSALVYKATSCVNLAIADEGCFVIYTTDAKRFVIPLVYLRSNIFRALLKMSEKEFGLPRDGPIKLPCDEVFMKYIVKIIQQGVATDLERALIMSIAMNLCSLSSCQRGENANTKLLFCGQ